MSLGRTKLASFVDGGGREIMPSGVRVMADSIRRSVSMNSLSQYELPQVNTNSNNSNTGAASNNDNVEASGYASASVLEPERGESWTEEEHKLFLLGLKKLGKGDWRGISSNFVNTRTPKQVATHAHKYFSRRNNLRRRRRRSSISDITTDKEQKEESKGRQIVLKFNMHCDDRAGKAIPKTLEGGKGVEKVTLDGKASKPMVKGKTANPTKMDDRLQRKRGRKRELISPLPKQAEEDKKEEVDIEKMFAIINFFLELPSAVFDQLTSVHKPQYAIVSMSLSFVVMLLCIIELVYRCGQEQVTWKWKSTLPWLYYPPRNYSKPFGNFKDIIGLICATCQWIFATITCDFARRHTDNPIKISFWPFVFALGLLSSKFLEKPTRMRNQSIEKKE